MNNTKLISMLKKPKKAKAKANNISLEKYTFPFRKLAAAEVDYDLITAGHYVNDKTTYYAETITKLLNATKEFCSICDNDFLSVIITTWHNHLIHTIMQAYSAQPSEFPIAKIEIFPTIFSTVNNWFRQKYRLTNEQIDNFWLSPELKVFTDQLGTWLQTHTQKFADMATEHITASAKHKKEVLKKHLLMRENHIFVTVELALTFLEVAKNLENAKIASLANMTPFTPAYSSYIWESLQEEQKVQIRRLLTDYSYFGEIVTKLRKSAKLTQENLGKIIGIKPKTIFRLENGSSSVLKVTILALIDVFASHANNNLAFTEEFHNAFYSSGIYELQKILLSNFDKEVIFSIVQINESWLYD